MPRLLPVLVAALLVPLTATPMTAQAYDPEARLRELGITLPTPAPPVANYVRAVRTGNLVFLAGHLECDGTKQVRGQLGAEVTIEQGYASARQVGICILASLKQAIGNLDQVTRIVKVLGLVNSTADFTDHPRVVNGFSDLMVEVFGDRGRHARSAVGVAQLPGGGAVEVEMIVEVAP